MMIESLLISLEADIKEYKTGEIIFREEDLFYNLLFQNSVSQLKLLLDYLKNYHDDKAFYSFSIPLTSSNKTPCRSSNPYRKKYDSKD